ncbi:MAG: hypothetical protein ACI9YE_003473 [Psychroserpens sp.]|jgi:hypothetical protein
MVFKIRAINSSTTISINTSLSVKSFDNIVKILKVMLFFLRNSKNQYMFADQFKITKLLKTNYYEKIIIYDCDCSVRFIKCKCTR